MNHKHNFFQFVLSLVLYLHKSVCETHEKRTVDFLVRFIEVLDVQYIRC